MIGTRILASAAAVITALIFPSSLNVAFAQAQTAALTGTVTSAEEGAMEGVLVSAKKDGSTITITVATDDKGRYSFPAGKVGPGHYTLKTRAVGYDLDGPKVADVAAGKATTADLKLKATRNLAAQLSNAEWLASMPGPDSNKKQLYGCTNCHTLQRIVSSSHDKDEFLTTMVRMSGYANMSFPLHPQLRQVARDLDRRMGGETLKFADWLASINLSTTDKWAYPLKTLPRLKGRSNRVIITEYDLPRATIEAHDVIVDKNDGMVWFTNFGEQFLNKMDPKTGKVTEYPIPLVREGWPTGALDLEVDEEGNYWLGLMYQTGVAKFDKKTEKFTLYPIPESMRNDETQQPMVGAQHWEVDGKVWMTQAQTGGIYRLDVKSGKFEYIDPFKSLPKAPHSAYGIYADKDNNLMFNDYGSENVGMINAKTLELTLYPTPTKKSKPRRGRLDADGRLWFAEFTGDKLGMFDPKSKEVKEWDLPTPHTAPYDVVLDKNGEAWGAGMEADRIMRLDPNNGHVTEYQLPRQTNIRRVFVDNATNPVTFWVGNNEGASIVKLEPLD